MNYSDIQLYNSYIAKADELNVKRNELRKVLSEIVNLRADLRSSEGLISDINTGVKANYEGNNKDLSQCASKLSNDFSSLQQKVTNLIANIKSKMNELSDEIQHYKDEAEKIKKKDSV